MAINLNDDCKRVTWRLDSMLHRKLTMLAKSTKLTLEEVGNLAMDDANWDSVKKRVAQYQRAKVQAESTRKRASEALASASPEILDRLANMSPEEIAKVFKQ